MTSARPSQEPQPSRRKLATARELADFCGVPLATVYQWSHRGGGPRMIKVGRHLRARWEDVERWLDEQSIDTAA
ncbi:helix-turn-helix domain-containing protein [Streptomyces sp. NPDC007861]|uniref:helix-turn-helix transcriptional regulator n=1 Tax=Streptomyces sp. NPDC007861 TaxID=3154893 RepID=UPI0033E7CBBD